MTARTTGGEAVYHVLKAAGAETVFGLLGGSMLELYDAFYRLGGIRYVGARDERAAGHMADAYARISGRPGVVLGAQAGPGVVNLVTSVAEAHLAYSPLVVIAGAISRGDLGKDTFQEMDQVALFAPICKRSILVTQPNRLPEMVEDAIHLAMSGRRGPVVVHVPRDIMAAAVPPLDRSPRKLARPGPPHPEDVDRTLELMKAAKRPVIVAGAGFKSASGAHSLRQLAETLGVPVVASTGHADVMPAGHPLFAGQGGPRGNAVASALTGEADLILVLGARLAFNSTFHSHEYISASAQIVQVDIEASAVGRYFPVTLGIQADAVASAQAIQTAAHAMPAGRWDEWTELFRKRQQSLVEERALEAADASTPMSPLRALAEVRKALPRDAIVTLDTGNACLKAADRLRHTQCPGLITPLDFGLVGFGYAAAIGAKAASPERPVISIMGDGGFGYTMTEITTAVQQQLSVVAVVLDNGAWGAEKAYQKEFFGGRVIGADIRNPPYDEVAKLCGANGWQARTPDELAQALGSALESKLPCVIHVHIDPQALSTLRKDLFRAEDDTA